MKKVPLVSVVIVSHSNKEWLKKSIPSLLRQGYQNFEIIVVDNGSLDKAGELVEQKYSQKINVIQLEENMGFGRGCNAGFSKSKGGYVCFANEDMVFKKDFIERLVEVMEGDELVGASQGTIYSYDEPKKVQSKGLFFNSSGVLAGETTRKIKDSVVGSHEIFSAVVPFMVRRKAFEKVRGFDEDFFLYFEEVDLCWRMWLGGYKVILVPGARVKHKGGVSTGKLAQALVTEYSVRNRIQSYIKNLEGVRLVMSLLVQLVLSTFGWLLFLLRGKVELAFSLSKAWGWNVWHIRKTLAKRAAIQKKRKITDNELIERVGGDFPMKHLFRIAGFKRGL